MGIIKAITSAIGGSLADQWLEVFEPDEMGDTTVFTSGVPVRRMTAAIKTAREPTIWSPTVR